MQKFRNRMGWALAGALALALIATLARAIQAGPLDPPGPVASTMKTLGDLVPAWHQTLSSSGGCSSQRFSCVMGGAAVLDGETGLVWQKTPSSAGSGDWGSAQSMCTAATTGNREGWRVPSVEELLSLRDASMADGLPAGHPFVDSGGHYFWSTTAAADDERNAQYVLFDIGGTTFTAFKEIAVAGAWCVRGSRTENVQAPADISSWSRALSASSLDSCHSARFTCVLGNQAVLDRETGLVWEQAPGLTHNDWVSMVVYCQNLVKGGRRGWRLPTIQELSSLIDPGAGAAPWLPAGHPFSNVQFGFSDDSYYSDTTNPTSSGTAFKWLFSGGFATPAWKSDLGYAWCVRGGASHDGM